MVQSAVSGVRLSGSGFSVDVRHWIEPLTTQGSSFCKMDVRVNLSQRMEGRLGGLSHEQRPGTPLTMTILIDFIQQTQRVRGGQPCSWKLLLAVQRTRGEPFWGQGILSV